LLTSKARETRGLQFLLGQGKKIDDVFERVERETIIRCRRERLSADPAERETRRLATHGETIYRF